MTRGEDKLEWNSEQIEQLKAFWLSGLTAQQIGDYFHVSRSAITGKVHRLLLPIRSKAITERSPKPHKPRTPRGEVMPQKEPEAAPEPSHAPVRLVDAEPRHCRWLLDGETWETGLHICGRDKWHGHAYCEFHARKAFQFLPRRVA